MIDLFGQEIPDATPKPNRSAWHSGTKHGNPCIKVFGPGPEGAKCKTCALLRYVEYSKRYYKCAKRGVSSSVTTDHLINWPACGQYQAENSTK
ncbi:hypothetical protein [Spirosoma sordidisoli]|uniref:Uncharacterized protein n=1 Tax=Spirosoma sordidisoli TaxID=2502893 RepID=A0A4Q2UMR9_9BACT|nr:hypothetical protein [Spirosoma sordidisoli]RYC70694.1 hypothetical protein EQG79_00650 [Spirosoma sordidisoli]